MMLGPHLAVGVSMRDWIGSLHVDGWSVVWTVVTVGLTYLVARLAAGGALRLAHRVQGIPDDLALQAARVVRYFVILIGIGVELSVLGAPVQPVLAGMLLVGFAVVLMLRGIADNFGAGLVLQVRHPLRLGDLVEWRDYVGRVCDLNSRSVVLATRDGRTVHVPNRRFMDSALVNHSTVGHTRSALELRAATDDAAALSRRVHALALTVRGVLAEPRPSVLVSAVDMERTSLVVQVWHAPGVGPVVCSRVASAVHRSLSESGLDVAVVWPPPAAPLTRSGAL